MDLGQESTVDQVAIQVGRDSCVTMCSTGILSAYKNLCEKIRLDFLKEILLFLLMFLAKVRGPANQVGE